MTADQAVPVAKSTDRGTSTRGALLAAAREVFTLVGYAQAGVSDIVTLAGASVGTATAYIADITPPESRSKRMGLIGAAFGIGFVLGPAIGGLLSQWSVVAPFWFAAFLSIINAYKT